MRGSCLCIKCMLSSLIKTMYVEFVHKERCKKCKFVDCGGVNVLMPYFFDEYPPSTSVFSLLPVLMLSFGNRLLAPAPYLKQRYERVMNIFLKMLNNLVNSRILFRYH